MKKLTLVAALAAINFATSPVALAVPATTSATSVVVDQDNDGVSDAYDLYPANPDKVFLPGPHTGCQSDLETCPGGSESAILANLARCAANSPNCEWEWVNADGETTCTMVIPSGYAWVGDKLLTREEIRSNRLAVAQARLTSGMSELAMATGVEIAALTATDATTSAALEALGERVDSVETRVTSAEAAATALNDSVVAVTATVGRHGGYISNLAARPTPFLTVGFGAYAGGQTPIGYGLPDGTDANDTGAVVIGRGGSAVGATLRLESGMDSMNWQVGLLGDFVPEVEPFAGSAPFGFTARLGPTVLHKLDDWSVGIGGGGFAHLSGAGVHASTARAYGGFISPRAVFPLGKDGRSGLELGGIFSLGSGGGEAVYRLEEPNGSSQFGGVSATDGLVVEGGAQLLFTHRLGGRAL